MLTDRTAYNQLAGYEADAKEHGSRVVKMGTTTLTICHAGKWAFTYQWGERMIEKHTALSVVKTYGVESR